jgi:hypothetical protein
VVAVAAAVELQADALGAAVVRTFQHNAAIALDLQPSRVLSITVKHELGQHILQTLIILSNSNMSAQQLTILTFTSQQKCTRNKKPAFHSYRSACLLCAAFDVICR